MRLDWCGYKASEIEAVVHQRCFCNEVHAAI
ncbi:MAG: hypothetical protein ACJA2S_002241 [Cyclobacteriaceae bacterium]|jgi:hypothetical protein